VTNNATLITARISRNEIKLPLATGALYFFFSIVSPTANQKYIPNQESSGKMVL
jgi:hypothetical protein